LTKKAKSTDILVKKHIQDIFLPKIACM